MSHKPNTHHFDQLASLYEQFAEDVTDETLASRLGAPQGLDESDPADAAMLAGMPEASLQKANALRYLALLDLNQEADFRPDAPVYGVPDPSLVRGLLQQEMVYMQQAFSDRPSLAVHASWREAFELCFAYDLRFADPEYTMFLPKRLS